MFKQMKLCVAWSYGINFYIIPYLSYIADSFVYLCDFHREQAWERWLSASHNNCTNVKAEILVMLRNIANSRTQEEFDRTQELLLVI